MDLHTHREKILIGLLLVAYFALRCIYLDAVPRWDAATYWGGLAQAVDATKAISSLTELPRVILQTYNVFGHPAMGYIGILVLGQLIDYPNLFILNITNLLLATLSILCVFKIFRWFLDEKNYLAEVLLATAIFAFDPLFFGSSIFLNTDFPVLVFFTAALACLLYGRYTGFSIFSLFMIFSKETGIIFWLAMVGGICLYSLLSLRLELLAGRRIELGYLLPPTLKSVSGQPLKLSTSLFRIGCLLFPGIIFKLYSVAQKGAMWAMGSGLKFDSEGWNCFGFNTRVMSNRAGEIFILNFHWVVVLVSLVALFIGVGRHLEQRNHSSSVLVSTENEQDHLNDNRTENATNLSRSYVNDYTAQRVTMARWWGVLPILVSFLAFVAFNLSYITYIIPRYVVYGGFFLIIFALLTLPLAFRSKTVRCSILTLILALFFVQTFRTVDPLSLWFFGSAPFNEHKILQIDSAGEAQGNGFVYNSEFTAEDKLFGLMQKAMPLKPESVIITWNKDPGYAWTTMGGMYVDKVSLKRTVDPRNSFNYNIIDVGDLQPAIAPLNAFYVYMPWLSQFSNEAEELAKLQQLYHISEPHTVKFQSHSLRFYRLNRATP